MRCFIAIDINENIRNEMVLFIRRLKELAPNIKWVPAENLHLTLKFLGDTTVNLLKEIEESLKSIVSGYQKFHLKIKGAGVFPDYSQPRVLWVGVEDLEALNILFYKIDKAMESLGFQREKRKFNPHLTIARIKVQFGLNPLLRELRGYKEKEFGKIDVSEILLKKSILKPVGAEYENLFSIPMGKED